MTDAEKTQFQHEINERAAIREFDGGEDRATAERNARIEVVNEWKAKEAK